MHIGGRLAQAAQGVGPRHDREPTLVARAAPTPLISTLRRVFAEFREDNLTDWAAALTYYGLLSLFPALIALVSILGLIGDPETTTRKVTEVITEIGPESAAETFSGPVESIASSRGTAGFAFVVGLAVALWSASGYVGAFIRASNVIYDTEESRPFWKLRPLQIAITLTMVVLTALLALGLVLTGPIVGAIADAVAVGSTAVTIWEIAKWPAMATVFIGMVSLLYYTAPDAKLRGFRWVTPGAGVAIVVWALASAAFALYVANFGSYDKTYGTLGGLVAVLVWLWITNVAILFGHALNAQLERDARRTPPRSSS
jgi:membrane protein